MMTAGNLVFVGALHVDDLVWPRGKLVLHASNPVRRRRRVGGVAANAARAAASLFADQNDGLRRDHGRQGKLGRQGSNGLCPDAAVALIAATGDDVDAQWLVKTLDAAGVSTLATPIEGCASGHYTVVHDATGELFVGLSDTAIAERLTAAMVKSQLDARAVEAIVLDANLSTRCIEEILAMPLPCEERSASTRRVALAVSPAKAMRFANSLDHLDLLICNRREAAALSEMSADRPLSDLADALCQAGVTRLVLSDGADPIIVQTVDTRQSIDVEPMRVEDIASVNGAGDALAGATVAAWVAIGELAPAVAHHGLPAARAIMLT